MRKAKNFTPWFIIGIVVFTLLFFGITISLTQAKGKPQPVSPQLILADSNIVTYEGAKDRLRVWGNDGQGYSNIWTAEGVHYPSIAIGNIDNDGLKEIVGVGYCKKYIGKGKKRKEYQYKIFINAYKESVTGIWKTTYYDEDENNIIEELSWLNFEIVLNDIDGDWINEIILMTKTYLAVYKYDSKKDKLKKIVSRQLSEDIDITSNEEEYSLRLQSVTVGDIDGDGEKEIIAAGHLISIHNEGYIFICNLNLSDSDSSPELILKGVTEVDFNFENNSLRAGNFDGDDQMELCSTAYQNHGNSPNFTYTPYLLIGDYDGASLNLSSHQLGDDPSYPWNHLDVGDLDGNSSQDEIAVVIGNSKQIWIYSWDQDQGNSPEFPTFPAPPSKLI